MTVNTIGLIILAAIVAAGLAFMQYYWGKRRRDWWVFAGLRFLTYLALFLLLINPKIEHKTYRVEKPKLVLAVDNSKSIEAFQEGNNVLELVGFLRDHAALKANFDLDIYRFGEDFIKADSLDFSENQTQIGAVFAHLKKLYPSATAPTVLITDGNQTYGRDYEFEAYYYNQQVFPVVVGDTALYSDLVIDQVNVNRYAFLHNKFPIEVFVSYEGQEPVQKQFRITREGRTVYTEQLKFDSDHGSRVVNTTIPADQIGVHTYEAFIEPIEQEKNTANNAQKFAVEVIDQQTNVLLLASFIHPDLGALKKAIERNQQRKADIHYINGEEEVDFGGYQLVVFYQPEASFKTAYEQVDRLGMNLLTITGTKTDYRFLNGIQPFFTKEVTSETEYYLPHFNAGYGRFQLEDIGFNDFPPLEDGFGDVAFKHPIDVVLEQRLNGFETENPLLATLESENRRYGFLFGENLWQWRGQVYRDLGSFEEFDVFFGKLVQYLASNKRRQRLTVDFESFYRSGESILMKAYFFDQNYEFDPRGKLIAEIKKKENEKGQEFPFLLKNNRFELNLSNLEPGTYTFKVTVEGENLIQEGEFTIIEFEVEKQFVNANYAKLKRIAEEEVYFLTEGDELVQNLLSKQEFKPVQKSKITRSPLIDWWYLLPLIVLTLSLEWFIRKYKGLI